MAERKSIEIQANGVSYRAPFDQLLEEFLRDLGLVPELVVVERNLEAVSPSERRSVRLQEGDRLEIVRIVAGG